MMIEIYGSASDGIERGALRVANFLILKKGSV